jgi:protein-disulfide isomerase
MNTNTQAFLIPGSIIIAGALIAVGIYFSGTGLPSNKQAADTAPQQEAIEITDENSPFIGDPNAPLTVYYWSDFQCPFCKQFEETSLQNLVTDYVNTNKMKVVFKDLQFLGQDSLESALIARSVWELYPDKYYVWREGYFAKQDEEQDIGFGDKESVIAYTRTVSGIDADKVLARINEKSAEYESLLAADHNQGATNGIGGTPGLIVGEVNAPNPLNYAALKSLVEGELK